MSRKDEKLAILDDVAETAAQMVDEKEARIALLETLIDLITTAYYHGDHFSLFIMVNHAAGVVNARKCKGNRKINKP